MRGKLSLTVAFMTAGFLSAAAEPFGIQITIDSNTFQGAVSNGILSFKGIPYASPPEHELRWRQPQRVGKLEGVQSATEYKSNCAQIIGYGNKLIGKEDCLYLNVW